MLSRRVSDVRCVELFGSVLGMEWTLGLGSQFMKRWVMVQAHRRSMPQLAEMSGHGHG